MVAGAKVKQRIGINFKSFGMNFNNGSRKNNKLREIPIRTSTRKGKNLATLNEAPNLKRNNSIVFIKKREQVLPFEKN